MLTILSVVIVALALLIGGWIYLMLSAEGIVRPGLLPVLVFTAIVLISAYRELRK